MNYNQKNPNQHQIGKYSIEEKRNYYMAWKKSGSSLAQFCKEKKVSRSALYRWSQKFKKEENDSCFSPLVLKGHNPAGHGEMIHLKIGFPNKTYIKLSMPKNCLASFIKDIGYEITVMR